MTRKLLVLTPAALIAATGLAPRAPAQALEAGTVPIYVMAAASNGHLVTDLRKDEIEVLEDGIRRDLREWSADPAALALLLLFDVSPSLIYTSKIEDLVSDIAKNLRGDDRMSVGRFGPDVVIGPSFTRDLAVLRQAARGRSRLASSWVGPSPLWDGLDAAITALETQPGRRVAIVVTDGMATGNLTLFGTVVQHAILADVEVDAIVPGMPLESRVTPHDELVQPWERPSQIAEVTGGLALNPGQTGDVKGTFKRMIDELHAEHLAGFRPGTWDGRMHALEVRMKRRGLTVRARRSYIASPVRPSAAESR